MQTFKVPMILLSMALLGVALPGCSKKSEPPTLHQAIDDLRDALKADAQAKNQSAAKVTVDEAFSLLVQAVKERERLRKRVNEYKQLDDEYTDAGTAVRENEQQMLRASAEACAADGDFATSFETARMWAAAYKRSREKALSLGPAADIRASALNETRVQLYYKIDATVYHARKLVEETVRQKDQQRSPDEFFQAMRDAESSFVVNLKASAEPALLQAIVNYEAALPRYKQAYASEREAQEALRLMEKESLDKASDFRWQSIQVLDLPPEAAAAERYGQLRKQGRELAKFEADLMQLRNLITSELRVELEQAGKLHDAAFDAVLALSKS